MWFKEYLYNIIIQPVHLLIYTVLVGSAITLAQESMIYAVVAIYFVIPAEKLLRKFFGFDNAGTLSAAGSFAGGALFSTMISKLNRPKGKEDKEEKPKNLRKASGNGVNADEEMLGKGGGSAGFGGGSGKGGGPGGGSGGGGLGAPTGNGAGGMSGIINQIPAIKNLREGAIPERKKSIN